jgi:cytochrome c oxidase subunit 2
MDKFQLFPDQASTMAPKVDQLFLFLCAVTVVITVLIFVLVLVFSIKYRRRNEDERPAATKTHTILEVIWITVPLLLCVVMFTWGAAIFVSNNRPPGNAMEINVVGKQWMWKIQHPDGQREIDELHVPVGQPVKLVMTSQDVIHDFSIPAFRVKMDVLPGRYSTEWFEATKPGEYHIFCNQYCGTLHSQMIGRVVVLEPDKYQDWLAGSVRGETSVAAGQKLFAKFSCMTCHSQKAPTMANLYGSEVKVYEDGVLKTIKADDNYLRESIVNPNKKIVEGYQPLMPSFQDTLTEEEIFELISYIKTLGQPGGRVDDLKMNNRYVPPGAALPPEGHLMGGVTK